MVVLLQLLLLLPVLLLLVQYHRQYIVMCCNSKGLSRLGVLWGLVALVTLLIVFVSGSWIYTKEPVTLQNSEITTTVSFRIGLWRVCPSIKRINSSIREYISLQWTLFDPVYHFRRCGRLFFAAPVFIYQKPHKHRGDKRAQIDRIY